MKEIHKKILEAIKGYYLEKGYGPTVREIGEMVGYKSTSTTQTHLEKMEHLGLIERTGFSSPRSIKIPGFNYEKEVVDNKNSGFEYEKSENETQTVHNGTVFVLHGYWVTPMSSGSDIFGVSADLDFLQKNIKVHGEHLLDVAKSIHNFKVVEVVTDHPRMYSVQGEFGTTILLKITEHKVEKGTQEVEKK